MNLIDSFNGYAARSPSRARRALYVFVAGALTVAMWAERGWVAGLAALCVYGPLFVTPALKPDVMIRRSRSPVLESALLAPLLFLALAYSTELALWACAAIGVAGWLLLLPVGRLVRRRRSRASEATG